MGKTYKDIADFKKNLKCNCTIDSKGRLRTDVFLKDKKIGVLDSITKEIRLTVKMAAKRKELVFDLKNLIATDKDGNVVGKWKATSGRPGTTFENQGTEDEGPIPESKHLPEGTSYYVDPSKIQRWNDIPFRQKFYSIFGQGQWPGGLMSWGFLRVEIDIPDKLVRMNKYGYRKGFFIHGGAFPGSAGCIDLSNNYIGFFEYLKKQSEKIPLIVKY